MHPRTVAAPWATTSACLEVGEHLRLRVDRHALISLTHIGTRYSCGRTSEAGAWESPHAPGALVATRVGVLLCGDSAVPLAVHRAGRDRDTGGARDVTVGRMYGCQTECARGAGLAACPIQVTVMNRQLWGGNRARAARVLSGEGEIGQLCRRRRPSRQGRAPVLAP
jgi:hypothetical protein